MKLDESIISLSNVEITPRDVARAHETLWTLGKLHDQMDCFLQEHPEVKAPADLEAFSTILAEKNIPIEFARLRIEADLKKASNLLLDDAEMGFSRIVDSVPAPGPLKKLYEFIDDEWVCLTIPPTLADVPFIISSGPGGNEVPAELLAPTGPTRSTVPGSSHS